MKWEALAPSFSLSLSLAPLFFLFPPAPPVPPSAPETLDALVIHRCHLDREGEMEERERGGGKREVAKAYIWIARRAFFFFFFLQMKQADGNLSVSSQISSQSCGKNTADRTHMLSVPHAHTYRKWFCQLILANHSVVYRRPTLLRTEDNMMNTQQVPQTDNHLKSCSDCEQLHGI